MFYIVLCDLDVSGIGEYAEPGKDTQLSKPGYLYSCINFHK